MCLTLCLALCLFVTVTAGCGADSAAEGTAKSDSAVTDAGATTRCYGANDCPPGYLCNEFGYCSPLKGDAMGRQRVG